MNMTRSRDGNEGKRVAERRQERWEEVGCVGQEDRERLHGSRGLW